MIFLKRRQILVTDMNICTVCVILVVYYRLFEHFNRLFISIKVQAILCLMYSVLMFSCFSVKVQFCVCYNNTLVSEKTNRLIRSWFVNFN